MFPWVARKARFTESIRFRKATNPKRTNRADATPMTLLRRSPFSVRRSRAFSSSTFVISTLLFHVPGDENEPGLAHRDHEGEDHLQKEDGERCAAFRSAVRMSRPSSSVSRVIHSASLATSP